MTTSHQELKQRVFLALKNNLILTLWAVFLLLVVYKSTILAEQRIDFVYHGAALINALAFSKVILVARRFDLSARIKDAPLIYPTLLKSAFFTVVLASFKILDDAAIGFHRHQSFSAEYLRIGWGYMARSSELDAVGLRRAHPFRWHRGARTSFRRG
jgi:hypothetical protein